MGQNDAFITFYTLLLGLGIATLLTRFADVLRRARLRDVGIGRGPRGDGSWDGPALPEKWPAGGPKVIWRRPIGGGYAGVTHAGGRVYTMDYELKAGSKDGTERALCFDAVTGKPLWNV